MKLGISVILIFMRLPFVVSQCFESFRVSDVIAKNQRFSGSVFRTHVNVTTQINCARLCLLRSLCKSFNYNEETQDCEINRDSGVSAPAAIWVHGEAGKIPQSLIDGCAYHVCGDHQICVPGKYGGHSCLDVEDCVSGQNLVNINANIINGTLQLACDDGLVGIGSNVAYCSYDSELNEFYWNVSYDCYNVSTCYVTVNGKAIYSGTTAVDDKDDLCENWDQTPYPEMHMVKLFASRSTNYCRDVEHIGVLKCPKWKTGPGPGPDEVRLYTCNVPPC